MNNSIERLFGGMVTALRSDIVPRLTDEYAAGQALAIIDLLQNLALRLDWAVAPLLVRAEAQRQLFTELDKLLGDRCSHVRAQEHGRPPISGTELLAHCDAMDARIGDVLRWLGTADQDHVTAQARGLIREHGRRDLQRELELTPRPLFAEISRGQSNTNTTES